MLKKLFGSAREADETEIEQEFDSTVPMTALLAAQSGGHPIRKVGYFEKRGNISLLPLLPSFLKSFYMYRW